MCFAEMAWAFALWDNARSGVKVLTLTTSIT